MRAHVCRMTQVAHALRQRPERHDSFSAWRHDVSPVRIAGVEARCLDSAVTGRTCCLQGVPTEQQQVIWSNSAISGQFVAGRVLLFVHQHSVGQHPVGAGRPVVRCVRDAAARTVDESCRATVCCAHLAENCTCSTTR